jgi:hypothetical protein
MIRRLQPGYKSVGAVHAKEDKERIRFCSRCDEMFGVSARLGPRIMSLDETTGKPKPKPSDYELWLECRNCGTVYPKHETRVEPELELIKEPSDGRQAKIQGTGNKKKGIRGANPRIKPTRDEIKDPDLIRELKDGT